MGELMKRWIWLVLLCFPALAQYAPPVGIPLVGSFDATGQTANFGGQTLLASAANAGFYEVVCHIVVTTAATTSTAPNCNVSVSKEFDTGGSGGIGFFGGGATSNTVGFGSAAFPVSVVHIQAGSNIAVSGTGYASSPVSTMAYAVHIRVYYLGP